LDDAADLQDNERCSGRLRVFLSENWRKLSYMNDPERPDPDVLLAQLKRAEAKSTRGKLKIFFGASPGVGKTYAMLLAAREKQAEGCEVVVGIVETHGRKETEALLAGMPIMPRLQIEYRGTTLTEMDLDAILTWHPGLAVVD